MLTDKCNRIIVRTRTIYGKMAECVLRHENVSNRVARFNQTRSCRPYDKRLLIFLKQPTQNVQGEKHETYGLF